MRRLTLDREADAFFTTEKVGRTRERTPEGFLLCRAVRIARPGEMLYGPGEVPITPGDDGIIRVTRSLEDLLRPETVASFNGKSIANDHPDEDVNPENWREHTVGVVINPRPGEDEDLGYMVADLLVTDATAIDDVEAGKVEVSCGYDADYEETAPGRGRQFNIIGNHVALVDKGRCGPRCAIGDSEMKTRDSRTQRKPARSWRDRILTAFKARDEEALTEAMEMAEDEITEGVGGEGGGGGEQTLVIRVEGAAPAATEDDGETEGEKKEDEKTEDDEAPPWFTRARAEDKTWRDGMEERLGKLEGAGTADADEGDDKDDKDAERTEDEELEEGDDKDDKTKDRARTGDSAAMSDAFQDMIARGEILAPGIKLPTFDGKATRKSTLDRMCAFRRRVLVKAMEDGDTAELLKPLMAGRDVAKLTCDSVGLVFIGGSELLKHANAGISNTSYVHSGDTAGGPPSIADINRKNEEFWRAKGRAS